VTAVDRRAVAVAGHTGDVATATAGLKNADPAVRATALGALRRIGVLTNAHLTEALVDPSSAVRRRAAEFSASHVEIDLTDVLRDDDQTVVEMAAWACGEHESNDDVIVDLLISLASTANDALVREAAVAALGAIGDDRAQDTIIAATEDKPAVRRRAVLALAPFEGSNVEAAIDRALTDRDWQVRQAAEDLRRAQNL
jgi:HEAT repeat protein